MQGTAKRNILLNKIQEKARDFHIPNNELEIDVMRDTQIGKDVARVYFRPPDSREKYSAELVVSPDNVKTDIVEREIVDLLSQLEDSWLEEGGRVTFYKNHGFFYRYSDYDDRPSLEVQCTSCGYMQVVERPHDILHKYRDIFLMKMLPEVHGRCHCPAGKYAPIQRPELHGLNR